MTCRYREELVGKRFISVRSPQKLKIQKISEWEWRSGVVRAVSGRDTSSPDLSVLIEFDDIDWTRREWVRVHYTFQLFLVEHTLVWAERPDPDKHRHSISWPGLSFRAIVDKAGLAVCKRKPVEFLVDRFLGLVEEKEIQIFQEGEENSHATVLSRKEVQQALKEWLDYQDGQKILLTTPTVLVGYRLEVYRAEGTTQWYTAVIQSYNHTSKTLSVTDDTVLEEHNEDPTLIQMHLIDDGVVDSILRGVEIGGIAPRRRPRAVKQEKEQPMSTSRATSSTPAVPKSIPSNPKKSRISQQSAVTVVSPALQSPIVTAASSDPEDGKGGEGTKVKLPNPKDKKWKLELHQNSGITLNSNTKRIKTEHEDNKVKRKLKKFESKLASEVQISVRVSPRHIKDIRTRQQSSREQVRENDVCELNTSTESVESDSSNIGSNKVDTNIKSVSKIKVRSNQKVESLESTSLKSESPKIRTNSSRGSSNSFQRRSLNRTPTEASFVIINSSNLGSISSKRKRKADLGSNSAKIGNSDNKKTNIGIPTADNQTISESASSKRNRGLSCSGANYCDLNEEEFKSIKNTNKTKEKHSESVSKAGVKKSARALCPGKQNKHTDKNKNHGNSHEGFTKSQGSVSAVKDNSIVSRENLYIDDSPDTMHYIKKKQSLLAGGTLTGSPQNSCISVSNIDLNRSLTDQIARAEKLSSINGEEKSSSVSTTLSSPICESYTESPADHDNDSLSHYRDNRQTIGPHNTNKCMVWSQEERSQSRNSDGQCSSGLSGDECRRPGSRFDDLKCSSKSSPTSSPLIVDKSEPVQIYRDPELMSKNPVRSNVPNMHNSHKSYPQLHNPIPTQASRPSSVGMTSTSLTSALDRQSRTPVLPSVAYPPLLGASLSNLLPPGLHQLDPATLALHQQLAVQQQHVAAAIASQYSNVLSMSYPPRGNLSNSQLEHLWQQKYPVPTAPPWMIAKHRDNFRHEVRVLHEHEQLERERMERERELELREREQRERKDREKRMEKERLDRERFEREKLDQERTEREQIEREKQEKERQDHERLERERNRVLKESVDSQAAVDHHFTESLRLASQRAAQTGMWPTPSITLGTGKPKGDGQHSVKLGEVLPDEKIKQEQLGDTDYRNVELMRTHKELMTKQEEFLKQRKYLSHVPMERSSDAKATDMSKDIKSPVHVNYLQSTKHEQSSGIAPVPIKQELGTAKFSLYGYQPEKYTFITTDQLNSFELDKVKNEKFDLKQGDCHSPRRKELSVPPPLIKDTKPHSSVIVENKVKDCSAKSSPLAHQQYQSHMSPHQQPKPAHTPDRPRSNSSSPGTHGLSPSMAHSQHIALRAEHVRQAMPRSQSPLRIASPQQLSAAVMQPMDYRCQKQNRSRGSPGSNISVQSTESVSLAIAQPPVALPLTSVAYTYSLIQQGLVPNPIYTNNSAGKCSDSQRTVSVTGTAQVPRASQSPLQNYSDNQQGCQQSNAARTKQRKGLKEGNSCKRQKVCDTSVTFQANNLQNLSVPCTTTQISHLTIQSPYSTGSVTVPNYTNTQSRGTYLASTQQAGANRLNDFRDFNSFKLFVDKTVQNAFNSDPEFTTSKDGQSKKPSGEQLNEQQQQVNKNSQFCQLKSSLERSCSPLTSQQNIQSQKTDALSNASNSNSALSYSDSISRVVNGQIDTDSDTLSVPSPPSHPKQEQTLSPHNAAKHPNLKKAWLQRHIYSDEDKQEIKPPVDLKEPIVADVIPMNKVNKLPDDLEKENDKEQVKNCYVNCSYISPSKEGGSKSPISTIQASSLPNGISDKMDTNDELTTSASETETQTSDSSSKKRVKTKQEKLPNSKKLKSENEDESSTNSGQKKKSNRSRNKDKIPKNAADNMSEEQIKKIVENCKDSVKEKPLVKEAPSKLAEEAHTVDIDELSDEKLDQAENETSQNEDQFDTDSSSKKSDSKKEKQTKKDKNIIRDKHKNKSDVEMEANIVYVPPPSMLKDTEQKAQQNTFSKPLVKVPDSVLRKTCEPFLQDGSCSEVTPKLMKCRECKMTPTQRGKTVPNIFCRFYAFRRLKYSQRGFVTIDGFSELTDAEQDDIEPWIPKFPIIEPTMDVNTAWFIIQRLGDKFCELVQQEKEAQNCSRDNVKIAWKRAVTGVREMCDVCDTTLFNMHWVCHKCGFVVCLDCYMVKAKEFADDIKGNNNDGGYQEEQREWLTCSANRLPHEVDKLMLTQIIPADALWEVGRLVHEVRERWDIAHACPNTPKLESKKNGIRNELMHEAMKHISPKNRLVNGSDGNSRTKNGSIKNTVYNADSSSPLSLLADVASMDSEKVKERSESPINSKKNIKNAKSYTSITEPMSPGSSEKKMSTLRELLTKTAGGKVKNNNELNKKKSKVSASLNDIIQKVVEKHIPRDSDKFVKADSDAEPLKLMHYMPRLGVSHMLVREAPIIAHNLTETSVLYPDVPHSWLCDGRLLQLLDPRHRGNTKIFMEQWHRGQPVLVSRVDKYIDEDLWKPDYFSKHFGKLENDLINCRSSCVVVGQPMKHFWDGFACMEERLVDEEGTPMMLKLKDWPPGDDFSDILPQQFNDLMQALPLPEYTQRDGRLNLVSRLPDFLVKPDLGPKMYIAYGSAHYPKEGTTNLHLDVSDAVNLMVFVGYLEEERGQMAKDQDTLKAMDVAHCDPITKRRIREVHETPGALWHIFDACDADKIRDFLNKVGKERGEKVELHHDPIHDQSWYLDELLRDRLAKEYGVSGYTILQCLGDAIFIPAGAPHQVRNLNNCIKVAEDFVSPENVHRCFQLTQEFRHLSDGHSNHEDKLQIKNIIYHAVKDAIAILNEANPDDCDD